MARPSTFSDPRWPLYTTEDGDAPASPVPLSLTLHKMGLSNGSAVERHRMPEENLAGAVLHQAMVDAESILAGAKDPYRYDDRPYQAMHAKQNASHLIRWLRVEGLEERSLEWWCALADVDAKAFRQFMIDNYLVRLKQAKEVLAQWYNTRAKQKRRPVVRGRRVENIEAFPF